MFAVPCVAPAEAFGYKKADRSSLKSIPVSPQHPESQFPSEHNLSNYSDYKGLTIAMSSPVSTLIEELLVMIFDDVITSESSCQCRDTRTGRWLSSPRNLASVSRSWKAVVFGCPQLWRHVHLTPLQSIHALKEHLGFSSPLPIHLTVHQWPFRNPTPAAGPFSVVALTAQLQSILSPLEKEGICLSPVSQRVESITVSAIESSTFPNFVLQTWTGPGCNFPVLRQVTINGNVCATWSRTCFFDGRNAPALERLELSNVVLAQDMFRLPWGVGLNLTTLVWSAPANRRGSLIVSVLCFHHIVSSFPSLTTLELQGHVVGLEFVTLESLEESGLGPLAHIRDLRVSGRVFANARAAYVLFRLLPSVRHVAVRGRACTGPPALRTVTLALQGLIVCPKAFGWPIVLQNVDHLELECLEDGCEGWRTWCLEELEAWRHWREMEGTATRVQMVIEADED